MCIILTVFHYFTKFMYHERVESNTKHRRTSSQPINWNRNNVNISEVNDSKCKMKHVHVCVSTITRLRRFLLLQCEVQLTNEFEGWHTSIRWRGNTVGKAWGGTPDSCIKKTVSWLYCRINKMRKRSCHHVKIPAVEVMCTTWRQGCEDLHCCLLSWWQLAALISLYIYKNKKLRSLLNNPSLLPPLGDYPLSPEVQISQSEDSRWAEVIRGFPVGHTKEGKHSNWMPLLQSAATGRNRGSRRRSRAPRR